MHTGALRPYEDALSAVGPLVLRTDDGRTIELDIARWLAPVDAVDRTVVDRCAGPTLDVGCGPGRFVAALAERGTPALGVDIAATAVELTRRRGVPVLLRNVFEDLPGQGRWPTVLLMDGNIGIDADPYRLLLRLRAVLRTRGRLLVETEPDADLDEAMTVRFTECGSGIGPSFRWARVGLNPLLRHAIAAGYRQDEVWTRGGRTFVTLLARPLQR